MKTKNEQESIFSLFVPRHKAAWNTLVMSYEDLETVNNDGFRILYCWENFIIRLYIYRKTCETLLKLSSIKNDTTLALKKFDKIFKPENCAVKQNVLYDIRHIFEHFDDYAEGSGKNKMVSPHSITTHLDFDNEHYNIAHYRMERELSMKAANALRKDINKIKKKFVEYYKSES